MSLNKMMGAGLGLTLSAMLLATGAVAEVQHQPQVQARDGANETASQSEGVPPKAAECKQLAVDENDTDFDIEGKEVYENNAKDFDASELDAGDTFELRVDLLGEGNSMYNITCQMDADETLTFESLEKTASSKANPGGA
ncbi:hypothetical protein [Salinicola aestuarinus]|uniref:hypothetical protein n=1 Tax=Salinicola aestuarinus TaxID=1949082 RepID=UPI000DA20102|nr:hypothetical protein [Salinicola aestuarinus]